MKFDLEKFGTPLAIVAAILAIWYYLRGGSGVTQAIVNNPATNVPGVGTPVPGLTQVLYSPQQGGGVGGPPQAAPSIANTVAAANNPMSPNPTAPDYTIPAIYTYNFSPQFALSKLPLMVAMSDGAMAKKPGRCGCGGSSGGCGDCSQNQSCTSKCDQINARFPDGRGTCLTTKPPKAYAQKMFNNLVGYASYDPTPPVPPFLGVANG